MNRGSKCVAGGLLTLALVGGSAGVAAADSSAGAASGSPAVTLTAATSTARHHHPHWRRIVGRRLKALLRHSVHADFTVHHKGAWITVSVDRGKLDASSSSSISLTRADGVGVSAQVTSSTKFLGIPQNGLVQGDLVVVAQTGGAAIDVLAVPPRAASSSATAPVG